MGFGQPGSGVVVRSTKGHSKKSGLHPALPDHIHAFKEVADADISQHAAVKVIHGGFNRGGAA
jgi:hypothetical protein